VYLRLHDACARQPGLVLAEPYDGHYLRFHTDCPVMGNNFVLTQADVSMILAEQHLLQLPARDIPGAAPRARYVFVRSATMFFVDTHGMLVFAPGEYPDHPNYPLVRELLAADPKALPVGYRMLYEMRPAPTQAPYARLFEIERAPPVATP
jgi:hypothetical protein